MALTSLPPSSTQVKERVEVCFYPSAMPLWHVIGDLHLDCTAYMVFKIFLSTNHYEMN